MTFWRSVSSVFFLILASWLCSGPALAQGQTKGKGKASAYVEVLKSFEEYVKSRRPDYRLVMKEETFPERPNAILPLHIETIPSGARVTLHELSTGSPVETCFSPCTLMRQTGGKYMVSAFRLGFFPNAMDRSEAAVEEETLKLPLYLDYFKAVFQHQKCKSLFEKSDKIDGEATPCYRIPAPMPIEAKTSGHCIMTFDLTKFGIPQNIKANYCTAEYFEFMSELAISWWRYNPKVDRGIPVSQSGLETKMTFRLKNEEGNLIPEPGAP